MTYEAGAIFFSEVMFETGVKVKFSFKTKFGVKIWTLHFPATFTMILNTPTKDSNCSYIGIDLNFDVTHIFLNVKFQHQFFSDLSPDC